MKLYVNGDSHSAGAEAVNSYCFAEDDSRCSWLGRQAHPDNLAVSYGSLMADHYKAVFYCDAESASSNDRIFRTTRAFLEKNRPDLVVIGWATMEREEWLHNGTYYQVSAGGGDSVPAELRDRYKQWVIDQAYYETINNKYIQMHQRIFDFHNELADKNIPHLFFNTYSTFETLLHLEYLGAKPFDWHNCFIGPYDKNYTYYNWLKANGCRTVNPQSYHFGPAAHKKWAEYLLNEIKARCLL